MAGVSFWKDGLGEVGHNRQIEVTLREEGIFEKGWDGMR